jgi:hypothetical protein
LTQAQFELDAPQDAGNFAILQSFELPGDEVAYKDFDGTLAWKASDETHKYFR